MVDIALLIGWAVQHLEVLSHGLGNTLSGTASPGAVFDTGGSPASGLHSQGHQLRLIDLSMAGLDLRANFMHRSTNLSLAKALERNFRLWASFRHGVGPWSIDLAR